MATLLTDADSGLRRATTPLGSDADADPTRETTTPLADDTAVDTAAEAAPGHETTSLDTDNLIRDNYANDDLCASDSEPNGFEYIGDNEEGNISPNIESAADAPEGTRAFADAATPTAHASRDSGFIDCDDEPDDDYKLSLESGRGVCAVRACGRDAGGEQFELDEAALGELLLRPGVAARPVVLVSVAGAFRGGKSFLLDFFLRYLYAEESARADGSWLGEPHEPLRGFSWRGGCRRETTGLVLWSQPFPVTLPSGQKVVVLLMDTQGSFDGTSSMRDCSLIFALSTLLSSVQVYNLSQRINESDLQFLQLFTEHAAAGGGTLPALQLLVRDWSAPGDFPCGAAGGADYLRHELQVRSDLSLFTEHAAAGGGALPALQLLVRDWSAPGDFPCGAAGGADYLRYELQVHAEQPSELREVRERLASSFERVACFLLPHPGLRAATDPGFSGQLADISEEFKASLRELVPLLLAPSQLRVKTVDGSVLCARDLALHLRVYLDTFRRHVPSPQSIVRAQTAARWLVAAAAARARLRRHAPARGAPACGRAALRACLAAARRAATDGLVALAARAGDEEGLANLEKDLDEQMVEYTDLNENKIILAVASAKEEWERLTHALRDPAVCAPERELCEDAGAARVAAVARYDSLADPQEPERAQLVENLEERFAILVPSACATSARNHAAAESAALAALQAALPAELLHPADLAARHAAAAERARASLRAARTSPARHHPDPHLASLDQQIAVILRDHESRNTRMNEQAVSAALQLYDASMELGDRCRHRRDLADTHERVAARAADTLRRRRRGTHAADRSDDFSRQLDQRLEERYAVFVDTNARNNEMAAGNAYGVFCERMDTGVVQLSATNLDQKLAAAAAVAKDAFKNERLSQRLLGVDDIYYNQMEQRIRARYSHYREENGRRMTAAVLAGAIVAGVVGTAAVAGGAAVAVAVPEAFVLLVGGVLRIFRP